MPRAAKDSGARAARIQQACQEGIPPSVPMSLIRHDFMPRVCPERRQHQTKNSAQQNHHPVMINNCSELCGACKVSSPNNRRSSNRRTPYAKLMPSSRKLSYNIAISRLARFAEGRRLGESVKKHVTLSVEVVGEPIINRSRSYQGWDRQQYSNKNSANSEFITETNFRFTRSFMEDFGEWAASFTKDWPAAKKGCR